MFQNMEIGEIVKRVHFPKKDMGSEFLCLESYQDIERWVEVENGMKLSTWFQNKCLKVEP